MSLNTGTIRMKRKDHMLPQQGDIVRLRSAHWVVLAVHASAPGVPVRLLPLDRMGPVLHCAWAAERATILPSTLQDWQEIHRATDVDMQAFAWNSLQGIDVSPMTTAWCVDGVPEPYQLQPLLAVLEFQAVRLLLADEAGMGKTMMSCLIAAHLWRQGRIGRLVVACPAALVDTWVDHLQRVGLPSTVLRSESTQDGRSPANPWLQHACVVMDQRLLMHEDMVLFLRSALPGLACGMLVVDEVHKLFKSSSAIPPAWIDVLEAHQHRVFVSATPLNKTRPTIAQVVAWLDPDVARLGADRMIVLRRRTSDIDPRYTTTTWLAPVSHTITFRSAIEEQSYDQCVQEWTAACVLALRQQDRKKPPAWVEKQLFHLRWAWQSSIAAWCSELALACTEESPLNTLLQTNQVLMLRAEALLEAGRALMSQNICGKWASLVQWLSTMPRPVLVCTHSRDTWTYLNFLVPQSQVSAVALAPHLPLREQQRVLSTWANDPPQICLATDAVLEGQSLHTRCADVVFFDMPPDQQGIDLRISRIRRYGQTMQPQVWFWASDDHDAYAQSHMFLGDMARNAMRQTSMFDVSEALVQQFEHVVQRQSMIEGGYTSATTQEVADTGERHAVSDIDVALRATQSALHHQGDMVVDFIRYAQHLAKVPVLEPTTNAYVWQGKMPASWQAAAWHTLWTSQSYTAAAQYLHPISVVSQMAARIVRSAWWASESRISWYSHDDKVPTIAKWYGIALLHTAQDVLLQRCLSFDLVLQDGVWQAANANESWPTHLVAQTADTVQLQTINEVALAVAHSKTSDVWQQHTAAWANEEQYLRTASGVVQKRTPALQTNAEQTMMFGMGTQAASSSGAADADQARLAHWERLSAMLSAQADAALLRTPPEVTFLWIPIAVSVSQYAPSI